ncbi:hypothetical protein V5799_020289 [Amblyomma americanum]|uniref:Serine proteinase inhibitor n=1 Tax=Amblyomma americanum TaxID=6943 RepID=A0AAQ4EU95_AMBAM
MKCPLIAFVSLYASAALMIAENQGEENSQVCQTPELPFQQNLSDPDDKSTILFIYNSTSSECETVLIDPNFRNHTFNSRFECVMTCNTGQGAPHCTGNPIYPENSTTVGCEEYDVSYYYNATSMQCENYTFCGAYLYKTEDMNFFNDEEYCVFDCGEFNESTICPTKQIK